jgi:hypothetical protein
MMKKEEAVALLEALRTSPVRGYACERLLGTGASAAVYEANKDGNRYAFKVYDPKYVDTARMQRQLNVKGSSPNVVKLFEHGTEMLAGARSRIWQ